MDLYYIDHISVSRRSWLHRVPVGIKMLFLVMIIAVLLVFESLPLEVGLTAAVLITALTARLPMRVYLPLALYPVVFLVIIYLSVEGLTIAAALLFAFRVLAMTGAVVLFFLSTSYPAIFGALSRVLPSFLVAALFFTYRSIFVISDSINNIRTAMHLRGGFRRKRPVAILRGFGTALGHFLVNSIDTSQRMANGLMVRGFANKIYYLDHDGEGD